MRPGRRRTSPWVAPRPPQSSRRSRARQRIVHLASPARRRCRAKSRGHPTCSRGESLPARAPGGFHLSGAGALRPRRRTEGRWWRPPFPSRLQPAISRPWLPARY